MVQGPAARAMAQNPTPHAPLGRGNNEDEELASQLMLTLLLLSAMGQAQSQNEYYDYARAMPMEQNPTPYDVMRMNPDTYGPATMEQPMETSLNNPRMHPATLTAISAALNGGKIYNLFKKGRNMPMPTDPRQARHWDYGYYDGGYYNGGYYNPGFGYDHGFYNQW